MDIVSIFVRMLVTKKCRVLPSDQAEANFSSRLLV